MFVCKFIFTFVLSILSYDTDICLVYYLRFITLALKVLLVVSSFVLKEKNKNNFTYICLQNGTCVIYIALMDIVFNRSS